MPENQPNCAELIDNVTDKESFILFLNALIADREIADTLEEERPDYYKWGGANGWQNSSISHFLGAAAIYFTDGPNKFKGANLEWKDLAEFLYLGKIYE